MDQETASRLLNRYLNNECTAEERALVEKWYAGLVEEFDWRLEGGRREEAQLALKQRIDEELGWRAKKPALRRSLLWYAAASVLGVIAVTFFLTRQPAPSVIIAENEPPVPGGNKAVLTLGDGRTISLDDATNGGIARQGGSSISQKGGQVVYTQGPGTPVVLFNTLATPKGGQFQLVLPDGSKVWLNAMSTIKFPTAFAGKAREVTVNGEAYFEVARNPSQPFLVTVNDMQVEVLGTHFNIAAYADEPQISTTLLEGKVKVTSSDAVVLMPGQQAVMSNRPGKQQLRVLTGVNTDQVMAWKNGYFQFSQAGITDVMKQIARWYDIDVRYEGKVPERKFSGEISRASSLDEVLKGLSATGIHLKREGNRIIILP